MPQQHDDIPFEIDHIIAESHGGPTEAGNLALACFHCNNFKGPNLAGVDETTPQITRLFHPRRHKWGRHFRWEGAYLVGRTPVGRATVAVLRINLLTRFLHRQFLMNEGVYPLA
jgi:hypothetical protein